MKTCSKCGRTFGPDALICAYDQTPLATGEVRTNMAAAAQPTVGEVLGSYRILEEIGHGGMGTIYRAEHTRLGRQMALKVLKQAMVRQTEMVHRFFEEARAVNEIGHANIVDVVDFVEDYGGNPPLIYMVMELLRGQDLRARINAVGKMEELEAIDIATQVARTLFAVHRLKILHRDLKPENIFLLREAHRRETTEDADTNLWDWKTTRGHASVTVKLLDFGVAGFFGERGTNKITEPGMCLGTPEYMSPEQLLGRDMDERTDVYSLGVLIYEMLVGQSPFESPNMQDVVVRQVKDSPPPISTRRSAPVSPELEALVMRCLEKQPSNRFQNMREVYKGLREVLDSDPIVSTETDLDLESTETDLDLESTETDLSVEAQPETHDPSSGALNDASGAFTGKFFRTVREETPEPSVLPEKMPPEVHSPKLPPEAHSPKLPPEVHAPQLPPAVHTAQLPREVHTRKMQNLAQSGLLHRYHRLTHWLRQMSQHLRGGHSRQRRWVLLATLTFIAAGGLLWVAADGSQNAVVATDNARPDSPSNVPPRVDVGRRPDLGTQQKQALAADSRVVSDVSPNSSAKTAATDSGTPDTQVAASAPPPAASVDGGIADQGRIKPRRSRKTRSRSSWVSNRRKRARRASGGGATRRRVRRAFKIPKAAPRAKPRAKSSSTSKGKRGAGTINTINPFKNP